MAMHFASFYLDLAIMRDVMNDEPGEIRAMNHQLLNDLSRRMHPDALRLVERWLSAASAERDEGGTPMVGAVKAGGRRLGVRTQTETLLLGLALG